MRWTTTLITVCMATALVVVAWLMHESAPTRARVASTPTSGGPPRGPWCAERGGRTVAPERRLQAVKRVFAGEARVFCIQASPEKRASDATHE